MPNGVNTPRGTQMVPGGMPGFPPGGPRDGFPPRRFPGRGPIRQHFPGFFFFPVRDFGFPAGRCYWVDEYGRCCDRYGRCCDRYGRCYYHNRYAFAPQRMGGWYGVPGGWDMMPDYDDMTGYDANDTYGRDDD